MEKEKIREVLSLERERLDSLKEKRISLDAKIKTKEALIGKYEDMLRQRKFSEAEDILIATGISLEEIMEAITVGSVLSLQERIKKEVPKNSPQSEERYCSNKE